MSGEAGRTGTARARETCRTARAAGLVTAWDAAPGLGALLAAGPDAASFLQTQLTSDVTALAASDCLRSARLTRTGGLVAHFLLARLPERGQPFPSFLLVLPRDEMSGLLEDLQGSHVSEDLLLEDASASFTGLVAQGPHAEELAGRVSDEAGAIVWPHSWTGDPGWLALAPSGRSEPWRATTEAAREAGFVRLDDTDADRTAWNWLMLEAGLPRPGADFRPKRTLLPATGLEGQTVSWTKGCYRGQEVVARVRTYGSVPQALRAIVVREPRTIQPADLPAPGDPLLDEEGSRIGAWASAGWSASLDRVVALAYLDRDHRAPRDSVVLQAGDADLEVEITLPPLHTAGRERDRAAQLHARALRRFNAGDDSGAAALLEEVLRLDPSHADAHEALGVILGRGGRYHEAIDVFQRLVEIAPGEPMVHTNLSLYYMKAGDREQAERHKALASLASRGGGGAEEDLAVRQAAEESIRRRDAERRRAMFADVLAVDPDDPLALMGMGNALLELSDHDAARDHLARALRVQPDNSALYVSNGKVLEALGRGGEAAETYRAGVEVAGRRGDLQPLRELEHRLFVLESASD